MYLGEVCREDFVLIQANCTVALARQLIERLNPAHVIVHRTAPAEYYYLYSKSNVLEHLKGKSDKTAVADAIGLHEYAATPAYDAFSDAAKVSDRAVVIEAGHVVGFYDKTIPPSSAGTRARGGRRAGTTRGAGATRGVGPTSAPERVPRSLIADFPEQVQLKETSSLLVSLSGEPGTGINLPIALPKGAVIDVIVQANRGFLMEGKGEGSLVVDDPQARSTLQFKLKATELGVGKITVLAFNQQQGQGTITLAPTVVPATSTAGQRREYKQTFESAVRVIQPDLSLMIFEDQSNGKTSLTFRLSALDPKFGLHLKSFGPVELRVDPLKYFQEFFEDIENLPLETLEQKAIAEQKLAAKGCLLFEKAIPKDLQVLLWSVRNQIKSVQIDSQEPWIPWEICRLQGNENGKIVEGPFFSEAFAITRWLMEIGMKPSLKLSNIALVLPRDSGLANAESEGAYVQSLRNGGRKVTRIPATYLEVIAEMKKGEYDGWHFTGHGSFAEKDPNRSAMMLEESQQLMPEDLSGVVKNVGNNGPLVFLNACQIGRSSLSLTGIGGWASRFLDAGAAAFIGAYWSVFDKAALQFAIELYDRLVKGISIGQATQQARLAIRELKDPTWLAYTVFADPAARIH
jgi:hypothetical protein